MQLTDFRVLTFDCYGTLIDWETGIANALRPLLARIDRPPAREAALATFARHETAQEAETPRMIYSNLLAAVHRPLAQEGGGRGARPPHPPPPASPAPPPPPSRSAPAPPRPPARPQTQVLFLSLRPKH